VEVINASVMDGDAEVFCGAVTAELGVHFLDVECLRESHGSSFAVTGDLDAEEARLRRPLEKRFRRMVRQYYSR